MIYRKKY